jgi:hypothetical protein
MADADEKGGALLQKLKDKAKDVRSSVAEKISEASEAGQEKLKEAMGEVNGIVPALGELGYSVESIQLGVGLIPDISIEVSGLTKTMDEATFHRVLEEQAGNKVLSVVLRTLQSASALQHKLHIMGMRSDTAVITLGLPPKLTLKFKKTS